MPFDFAVLFYRRFRDIVCESELKFGVLRRRRRNQSPRRSNEMEGALWIFLGARHRFN